MNASNKKLGYFAGATALVLGLGILSTSGCDEAAKQCGLECPAQGVAKGNAGISGYVAIDSFFRSVVNFKTVANGVAGDIKAELDGLQASFGITPAELTSAGSLGAAISAKIEGKVTLDIDAQPAKCEIDASVSASASVDCQVAAGCEIDPGMASVSCMGECTVEASASGECSADATLKCSASGPQVKCEGACNGSCTVDLAVAGSCEGACNGTCNGSTSNGASCEGMCQGKCELSGNAAASCTGTCNGSCEYTPPSGGCEAGAKVECEFMAKADAKCSGRCDGEFVPPSANCDASASCQASAKAEAKFQARCTPPSVDVKAEFTGGASAQAEFENAIGDLRIRLPRLFASLKRADLVVDAGKQLGADGAAAIEGTLDAIGEGDLGVVASYRIVNCVPNELKASASAITESGKKLSAQVTAAAGLTGSL